MAERGGTLAVNGHQGKMLHHELTHTNRFCHLGTALLLASFVGGSYKGCKREVLIRKWITEDYTINACYDEQLLVKRV